MSKFEQDIWHNLKAEEGIMCDSESIWDYECSVEEWDDLFKKHQAMAENMSSYDKLKSQLRADVWHNLKIEEGIDCTSRYIEGYKGSDDDYFYLLGRFTEMLDDECKLQNMED